MRKNLLHIMCTLFLALGMNAQAFAQENVFTYDALNHLAAYETGTTTTKAELTDGIATITTTGGNNQYGWSFDSDFDLSSKEVMVITFSEPLTKEIELRFEDSATPVYQSSENSTSKMNNISKLNIVAGSTKAVIYLNSQAVQTDWIYTTPNEDNNDPESNINMSKLRKMYFFSNWAGTVNIKSIEFTSFASSVFDWSQSAAKYGEPTFSMVDGVATIAMGNYEQYGWTYTNPIDFSDYKYLRVELNVENGTDVCGTAIFVTDAAGTVCEYPFAWSTNTVLIDLNHMKNTSFTTNVDVTKIKQITFWSYAWNLPVKSITLLKNADEVKELMTDNKWELLLYTGSIGMVSYTPNYSIDLTDAQYIKAYKAAYDKDENVVTMTEVKKVAAGDGVILKSVNNNESWQSVPVIDDAPLIENNPLIGVYMNRNVNSLPSISSDGTMNNYILNDINGSVGFYLANDENVTSGKAYLQIPVTNNEAKTLSIKFTDDDDDATGISEVKHNRPTETVIYNLQGVRLSAPQKGINIINGKKVVVK